MLYQHARSHWNSVWPIEQVMVMVEGEGRKLDISMLLSLLLQRGRRLKRA